MKTRGFSWTGSFTVWSVIGLASCGGSTKQLPPPPPPPDEDVTVHAMPEHGSGADEFSFETTDRPAQDPSAKEAPASKAAAPEATGPLPVPMTCPGGAPRSVPVAPAAATAGASTAAPPGGAPAAPPAPECYPPKPFVTRVCEHHSPSTALTLFAKGSPWKRAYVNGFCEAWNVAEGSTANDELEAGEEILVLLAGVSRRRGIDEGGSSLYGLRWNGNCVVLDEGQISSEGPPTPKHSLIQWNWLSDAVQLELRKDPKVAKAYGARRLACKTSSGFGSKMSEACADAGQALSTAVFEHVRNGGSLPPPDPVP